MDVFTIIIKCILDTITWNVHFLPYNILTQNSHYVINENVSHHVFQSQCVKN